MNFVSRDTIVVETTLVDRVEVVSAPKDGVSAEQLFVSTNRRQAAVDNALNSGTASILRK